MTKKDKGQKISNKTWDYFLDLVKTKDFQDEIELIRNSNLKKHKDISDFIYKSKNTKIKIDFILEEEVKKICRKFGLNELEWSEIIRNYIIRYGITKEVKDNLCIVLDKTELGEYESVPDGYYKEGFDGDDEMLRQIEKNEAYTYAFPIIIRISPYASERDIISFIKKEYTKQIKPLQKKYQKNNLKIGKTRHKDNKKIERNNFIYENKDLSRKEIASLVFKKYKENLDTGHIGKIISLENKKRK